MRSAAAKVLADDPDPRSGQALVKATTDKHWLVRAAALDAYARRGDSTLVNDIEPCLDDENGRVRFTAAAAIIRLSTDSAKSVPTVDKVAPPTAKPRQDVKAPGSGMGKKQHV